MKLVNLNLHKLMDERQARFISEQNPDIECYQEIVKSKTQKSPFYHQLFAANYGSTGTSLGAIQHHLQDPITITTREALWMKKNIVGATINGVRVYTLHGYNSWPFRRFKPWKEQMDKLFSEIDKWPKDMPMVIAGDFNTFSGEQQGYLILEFSKREFEAASFQNDNNKILDWVLWRNVKNTGCVTYPGLSDHPAIVFEFEV